MKQWRGWLLFGVLAIAVAAAAYLGQPGQDSPEHSSRSDAANGASAALLFAQAMGHPAGQVAGTFVPPGVPAMMFVFTPTSPYTADEAERTLLWVRSGGVLVYAAEQGDPELDHALGVARLGGFALTGNQLGNPVVEGVDQVSGAGGVQPLEPAPGQVPILRTTPWWYSSNWTCAPGEAIPSRSARKRPLSSLSR